MSPVVGWCGWLVAGVVAWTLAEYVLHRWDMHGRPARAVLARRSAARRRARRQAGGTARREHLTHHARLDVPARSPATWTGAVIVGAALAWWGHPALGLGWLAGHGLYEQVHWSVHARPPRSRYRRWARRHHLSHHLVHPDANYGVTSPVWDVVLRTHRRPAP